MLWAKPARHGQCFHGVDMDLIFPCPMNTIMLFPHVLLLFLWKTDQSSPGSSISFLAKSLLSYIAHHSPGLHWTSTIVLHPTSWNKEILEWRVSVKHNCSNTLSMGREKAKKQEANVEIRCKNSPKYRIEFILISRPDITLFRLQWKTSIFLKIERKWRSDQIKKANVSTAQLIA